jgi:hypothetical protein
VEQWEQWEQNPETLAGQGFQPFPLFVPTLGCSHFLGPAGQLDDLTSFAST